MDLQKYKLQFDAEGYLVIEDFFPPDLMDHLDGVIRRYYGDDPSFWHNDEFLEKAQTEVVPWFPAREGNTEFDVIEYDEELQQLTTALLGEGWHSQYCMVMFSKQGTSGQAWHQDCPQHSANHFNLNRLMYTSDITDEIGGQTVVVPGSHRLGDLPPGDPVADMPGQVVLRPRKGTLVLLHGHTYHRVLPIKGRYRFSTNFRSAPVGTPDDITDVCVYRNMRYRFSDSTVVEERRVR